METMRIIILPALVGLMMAVCGTPQTNTSASLNAGSTAEPRAAAPSVDALLTLDKQANEAYFKSDSKFFEQMLSDKLVMHEEGHRMNKVSVVKRIAGNKCDLKSVKLDEPEMTKIAADIYLLSYKATFDARCVGSDGKMTVVPSPTRAATLWARSGDRWLVAYHGQTLIIDPKNPPVATTESKSPPKKESSSKSAEDPLTNDLMAAETRVWEAWKEKDAKTADALTAANLSFENIFGSYYANKAETIKNWTGSYCDVKSFSVTDGSGSLISPTVAILTSKGSAEGSCSGQKPMQYRVYGTSVYVKDADSWKLAFTLNRPLE